MIYLLIFWWLSVLLDDNGHNTLALAGYIITVVFGALWLLGVIAQAVSDDE